MSADNRTITVGNVGSKPDVTKQPADAFMLVVEFKDWLGGATTLVTAGGQVFNPIDGDEPTAGTPSVVGTTQLHVLVSGGNDGYNGVLSVTGTMADGEIKQVEVAVTVKEIDYVAP